MTTDNLNALAVDQLRRQLDQLTRDNANLLKDLQDLKKLRQVDAMWLKSSADDNSTLIAGVDKLTAENARLLKDLKAVTAHNERIQQEKCELAKERDDLAVKLAHAQMDLESAIAKNASPSTEVHAQTPFSQQA